MEENEASGKGKATIGIGVSLKWKRYWKVIFHLTEMTQPQISLLFWSNQAKKSWLWKRNCTSSSWKAVLKYLRYFWRSVIEMDGRLFQIAARSSYQWESEVGDYLNDGGLSIEKQRGLQMSLPIAQYLSKIKANRLENSREGFLVYRRHEVNFWRNSLTSVRMHKLVRAWDTKVIIQLKAEVRNACDLEMCHSWLQKSADSMEEQQELKNRDTKYFSPLLDYV